MNAEFIDYPDRQSWLEGRKNTLGASEVACVLGMGFITPQELFEIKTRKKESSDLSKNDRVRYGVEAEEHLRALFALQNKYDYEVEFYPYRIYKNSKYPFLSCTLDGELTRIDDGAKGVLEIKTAWINSKRELEEWDSRIPQKYFCQILSQAKITNAKFMILLAQLIFSDGNSEIRKYKVELAEVEADAKYLIEECAKFWKYVENNNPPPTRLML